MMEITNPPSLRELESRKSELFEAAKTLSQDPRFSADIEMLRYKLREVRALMETYKSAMLILQTRLDVLNKELATKNSHNPIESTRSRLKEFESILEKMQRKNCDFSIESMTKNIHDIAGIRVVCPFISDVYDVFEMLNRQNDLDFYRVRDYIGKPKPNGYRSLHAIVLVPVHLSTGTQSVPVEIQLRTLAMDFWATAEHHLQYKKPSSDELFGKELKACADMIAEADLRMLKLSNGTLPYEEN